MRWPLGMCVFLSSLVLGQSQFANFECTESTGAKYRISTSPQKRVLRVEENQKAREIPLAAPNSGRGISHTGEPLAFNAKLPGKDLISQLDFSQEFSTQYIVQNGKTTIKVSLILDDQEKNGLNCKVTSGNPAAVSTLKDGTPLTRNAKLFMDGSSLRNSEGDLSPGGMLMVEASLRRFVRSGLEKTSVEAFADTIEESLRKITPASVTFIGNRLPPSTRGFWKGLLAQVKYSEYPETQRYLSWLADAFAKPTRDLSAVRSVFVAFSHSAISKNPDLKAFFEKETTGYLRKLKSTEIATIQEGMDGKSAAYLSALWGKATGQRTLASYPQLENNLELMKQSIGANEKDFDPSKVKDQIFWFFNSQWAKDTEARALYMGTATRLVSRLTPRQREDLMVWLTPAEKKIFQENFK
jgi:hypothetical protein